MAFLAGLYRHRQLSSLSIQPNYCYSWSWRYLFLHPSSTTRWLCSGSTESTRSEFPFENAYNILGVPETSSFSEIKASFRKLAKKTHPDLAESKNHSAASKRFIQILAAYEILSDSEKRIQYDLHLLSQRKLLQKNSGHCGQGSKLYMYESHRISIGSRIPLGTITGLGTSPEEGSCFVYNSSGTKTHVIMKHRTLLVKHMHWFQVGDEVSVCECRCSRARLPPSKFWLFEPRCGMHDIGGWYIETFGRDKKGRTVLSQRYWDGFDVSEQFDKRLHPAMYLLALAYRTLDLEDAKRRKWAFRDIFDVQMFRILSWCKKLV